jgi:surface protein
MRYMFKNCDLLETLDLSNWNTSNVTDMEYMFSNCTNLTTIYVGSNWTTSNVENSNSMFQNCTSLVGGNGTTYNSSNPSNKTYARVDGGTSSPGYLTLKSN